MAKIISTLKGPQSIFLNEDLKPKIFLILFDILLGCLILLLLMVFLYPYAEGLIGRRAFVYITLEFVILISSIIFYLTIRFDIIESLPNVKLMRKLKEDSSISDTSKSKLHSLTQKIGVEIELIKWIYGWGFFIIVIGILTAPYGTINPSSHILILTTSPQYYISVLIGFLILQFSSVRINSGKWGLRNNINIFKEYNTWRGVYYIPCSLFWNLIFFLWLIYMFMNSSNVMLWSWKNNIFWFFIGFCIMIIGNTIIMYLFYRSEEKEIISTNY
jgi:hypothetical protein